MIGECQPARNSQVDVPLPFWPASNISLLRCSDTINLAAYAENYLREADDKERPCRLVRDSLH